MTKPSLARRLAALPERVGHIIVAPRAAMTRIERAGGAVSDAVGLVVLGVVAFRLPELVRGLWAVGGPVSGALLRVVGLFVDEAKRAAWVVLPAATLVTLAAGRRRDASRDLELGAACYAPVFAVRSLGQMLAGIAGARVLSGAIVTGAAAAASLGAFVQAVRIARGRQPSPLDAELRPDEPSMGDAGRPDSRAWVVGVGVFAVAAIAFVGNAIWIDRHVEMLEPIRRGQPAPEFALPRIDGTPGTLALGPLRGQVVVLDFWATWCPPCIAMLPEMDALHRAWSDRGVAFLGINSDGGGSTRADIDRFLAEHPMRYPVGLDEGDVGGLYKVEALPTLVVIGRDGSVRKSFVGFTSRSTLDRELEEAVREPSPAPTRDGT
jgi:thiol-disulfide isomerase/thioredoxin